ncbi:redoxin domain-containing protein [Porticoccaceae bacterium]|jgi:peroxiredoxin Q/BCP|nr:redoxin domain-containing protein [Porticoccaceae bacterium]MCT2533200.1 redoxin domain-containing protein [SAR92 clade bacterium H231]MBT6319976.1 redoxin domain-containing protein [Porticoccaceae bacterium]MBT7257951.1 redoxin domain-containing protein [Porticoccaceae bacterium]MBT7904213.1 redoxin domain-containing protein [Porticoccaceae bacterium]
MTAIKTLFSTVLISLALLLSATASALEVGDQAPGFSLQATDGKTYSLEQFHNKQAIVIAWYPKAFTSGCTIECKSLAQNGHLLKRLDVTYFMASVDALEDNQAFAEENDADFPLLSDPSKKVAKAYDVLALYGLPKRHTIYIGKDGKVLFIDRAINAATSAEDMAAKLEELGIPARQTS